MRRVVRIIGLSTIFLYLSLMANSNGMGAKQYTLKIKLKSKVVESKEAIEQNNTLIPLIKIDDKIFCLNDFTTLQNFDALKKNVLLKKIELTVGKHKYEKLENKSLDVEWVIIEPEGEEGRGEGEEGEPEIIFKKINPTKYLVKVEGAKTPFWLVFSESFHKQWRIYRRQIFKEIVADYPKLKVKEAKHTMKFTPQDIRYLFKKPLDVEHQLVNGYANGWYVEPNRLGLGEDFTLVIYFWPQSLFYLGLGISGLSLLCCIGYLGFGFVRSKKKGKIALPSAPNDEKDIFNEAKN